MECSRGCQKRFKNEKSRAYHLHSSCPVKLQCPTCKGDFSSQRQYTSHLKVCKAPVEVQLPQPLDQHLEVDQAPLALDAVLHPSAAGDTSSTPVNEEVNNYSIVTSIDLPVVVHQLPDVVHQLPDVGSLDDFLDFAHDFDKFLGD